MHKNQAACNSARCVLGLLGAVLAQLPAPQLPAAEDRPALAVEADFEGGSGLVQAIDQEERLIRLVPTPHKDRGWACWWFVHVTGIRPGETLTLDVGDGPWATPDRAMVSLDRRTWQHTEPGKRSGKRIRYRPTIPAREAWFAWGTPFLPSDAAELVRAAAARCPGATPFELCRSREGRPVPALRVEEPARQDSRRLGIWIGARQHAWESGSSWVCRGLVEWLVSDDARAAALRKKALVVVVPIMDVDNVAVGAGGKEQKPHDHNRDWTDDPYFPAVAAAQREIRKLDAAGTLDLYLDLHDPAANDLVPFFFVPHRQAWPDPAWQCLQRFLAAARAEITGPLAYAGMLKETGPAYDPQWQTISDHWVRRSVRPQVLTLSLETPWNTPQSTPEGYLRIGRELGLAIERYFSAGPELTFFGWSDQHVQTNGDGSHLVPAIDAMNALPGTKYPAKIGGEVARPEFVLGCGDITEWPTHAAKTTYEELITKRLKFPAFDLVGNHDEGGKAPSETIKRWILARHGGLSYTFDRGGVHFIALFSKYDENLDSPAQPIHQDALAFLRADLAKLRGLSQFSRSENGTVPLPNSQPKPVIVAMHLCHDAITNRDELVAALGGANVLAVLGGHYHQATIQRYRGIPFVQLPSPWKNGPGLFTVIRITPERLVAIPYDYRQKKWGENPRAILDAPLGKIAGP